MNKTNKSAIVLIFLMGIMLFSLVNVSAEDVISGDEPASWWQNLLHSTGLASSPFSIVGDSRGCSLNADMEWNLANGETLPAQSASTYCDSTGGLFDTFLAGWTPYIEYKDSIPQIRCSSFDGCHVQLYCCGKAEPSSGDCDSDETLKTKSCAACTSSNWPYYSCPSGVTGYVCAGERGILYSRSSYKYCEQADAVTCYYKTTPTGTCYTRTYSTLSDCSTQTYSGYQLYNSLAECNGATTCTSTQMIVGGICVEKNTICSNLGTGGTKDCSTNNLNTQLEVVNIGVPPAIGENLGVNAPASTPRQFYITLRNTGTISETVNVEAGFYTPDYAANVAKLPTNSLFSIWSQGTQVQNCVGSEGFIQTETVTIGPGETKQVYITQSPLFAYMTKDIGTYVLSATKLVSYIGVYKTCCQKLANFEGCATGTGGFVKDKNGNDIFKTNWNFASLDTLRPDSSDITCGDGTIYGTVNYKTIGEDTITINKNYLQCISYKFYEPNGTLDINATNNYKLTTYTDLRKLSLSKDKIKTATSTELLASSCLDSKECIVENSSFTPNCISIARLREDGIITPATSTSIFDQASRITKNTLYAGTAGIVGCVVASTTAAGFFGLGVGALIASPAILGGCGAIGALIGGTATLAYYDLGANGDELLDKLKAKDDSSVGICVSEKASVYSKYTEWAAFFDIPGLDKGTTGLIIIIIGAVFIRIIVRK